MEAENIGLHLLRMNTTESKEITRNAIQEIDSDYEGNDVNVKKNFFLLLEL